MYTIYKCKISEKYPKYWQFGQIKFRISNILKYMKNKIFPRCLLGGLLCKKTFQPIKLAWHKFNVYEVKKSVKISKLTVAVSLSFCYFLNNIPFFLLKCYDLFLIGLNSWLWSPNNQPLDIFIEFDQDVCARLSEECCFIKFDWLMARTWLLNYHLFNILHPRWSSGIETSPHQGEGIFYRQ